MSTNLHLNDDDLVLHYYGEMPAADESRAATHLSGCGACQENYAKLQRVMAFVDSAPASSSRRRSPSSQTSSPPPPNVG